MSTGETPPSVTARFTSPSSTMNINNNKKYPGTPKSPMLNTNAIGNRSSQARQRLLDSKISAPRPMNLPSLRREHAVGTEVPVSSPAASHGWGSSTSSPSLSQPTEINKSIEQNTVTSPVTKPAEPTVESTSKVDPASSPQPTNAQTSTVRGWAVPTVSKTSPQPPTTDFPTAAEAAAKKTASLYDDKEYLKYASSDPNHTSWDEMVSEDLDDFQVDVVEFDDGTKVQVDGNEESVNPVSPSDRFTDDYDRSYPPRHHNEPSDHGYNKSTYRRSEDHGYSNRYSSISYDNRRHSTATTSAPANEERRTSTATTDRWPRRESLDNMRGNNNRRSSYDRKSSGGSGGSTGGYHPPIYNNNNSSVPPSAYHPTLLQRPRRLSEQSFRSDHSREEHVNPLQIITEPTSNVKPDEIAEITAAQREVMLTAAERAKKRRDEEEAEYEAARIRARQKADALARLAEESKKETKKEQEVKSEVKKEVPVQVEKTSTEIKSSSPVVEKKEENNKKASASSPQQPQTVKITKKPTESPSLPDTSKPWNVVAAKKEITIAKRPSSTNNNKSPKSAETTTTMDREPISDTNHAKKEKEVVVPTVDRNGKTLSKDEQNWELFVSKIKTDAPILKNEVPANDWKSYAVRLQKSVVDDQAEFNAKHKAATQGKIVEVVDYTQNEDWGTIPSHITQGRTHDRGWTRNDEEHGGNGHNAYSSRGRGFSDRGSRGARGAGRGRGFVSSSISSTHYNQNQSDNSNNSDNWRQHPDAEEQKQPVVTEILKHEPVAAVIAEKCVKEDKPESPVYTNTLISKKTRLTNLLKESSSPIFPNFIERLAGKKPANMSFMVDMDESDKDITMMDQPVTVESKINDEKHTSTDKTEIESATIVATSVSGIDAGKENVNVPEVADEMSVTSSSMSSPQQLPPKTELQHSDPTTNDTNNRKMNINPNYPVLVYQYPASQQSHNPEGVQQRPAGIYLMPQQQYLTSNQYMVSYPQTGTGVQPVFYPTLPWQQQQQQQPHYNNGSASTSPRPHYEQRRTYNNNFKPTHQNNNEWESQATNNGYQSNRFYNNASTYQRGNSYRKRGTSWSNPTHPRGRGNHAYQPRRYPDAPSHPLTSTENL